MFCRVLMRAVRCPLSPAPALHLPQMAPSNPGVNLCDLLAEAVDADAKSSDSEKSCSSYRYTIYNCMYITVCMYIYIEWASARVPPTPPIWGVLQREGER